jgi:hypothetical protein
MAAAKKASQTYASSVEPETHQHAWPNPEPPDDPGRHIIINDHRGIHNAVLQMMFGMIVTCALISSGFLYSHVELSAQHRRQSIIRRGLDQQTELAHALQNKQAVYLTPDYINNKATILGMKHQTDAEALKLK